MNAALPPVAIEGVAFWHTRLPGWATARAVICGEQEAPAAAATRPTPSLLAPTERRRAPDTVALALEVAARACEAAGRSPAQLRSVFASTYGDLGISDYMCATLAGTPTLISPTKFHNSVHNAAAGYWSIGTASHAPYTAHQRVSIYIRRALCWRQRRKSCATDSRSCASRSMSNLPVRLRLSHRAADCWALHWCCAPSGDKSHRTLTLRVEQGSASNVTPARSTAAALVADNALAPCLPFFEALADPAAREVVLALSDHCLLRAQVS